MPKIVRFHETGAAEVLKLEDLPLTEPGEGEVRLKVEAIGLNRAEVMFRQGQYLQAPTLPSRLGYEAAGTVDALGPGVSGVQIGDRVSTIPSFSMGEYGVYGESAIVPASAAATLLHIVYYVRPYQEATGTLSPDGSLDWFAGETLVVLSWSVLYIPLGIFAIKVIRNAYSPSRT